MNNVRIPLSLLLAFLMGCALTTRGQAKARGKRAPEAANTAEQSNAAFDDAVKAANEARIASRLDEAIESYTKAVRIRPNWPDGWWYLGAIYYEKDLYSQAHDAFSKLVVLEPGRGPAWAMLGLCQFQTRDYEQAITSLERGYALGLNGNQELRSVVIYHFGLLYTRFGQFEMAFDVLRQYERGYDNQKMVDAFGLIMLRMPFLPNEIPSDRREEVLLAGKAGASMAARRTDDARRAFDELLIRYPNDPNVHYSFGVFMIPQDIETSLKEFRRATELDPNHQPALVQMAFEYLKRREYETALPLAEKSVQLAPRMFPARNVLGRVLLELGQTERAITQLEEGVRLAPGSPEMHFALAKAYARVGRKEEADRENEIFKKLQEKYNQQLAPGQTDSATSSPTVKPNPEKKK
jgi:tetratricopeptide (TPR) repeat protein